MIKLFKATDTDFSSNGDIVINPIKAKIHKEDNGEFYLELETNLDYINYLVENNIIVANTPQGDQPFRVGNVGKTRYKLKTRCYHIFYDSENYLIADSYVVDKNCNDALNHLNAATDNLSPFLAYSDVQTVKSFRCVRKSLYEAITTVLERWGGHLVRDYFNIRILNTIGQDNGVTVRYAKNLKDITCEENWDNVVTKILPVGKDGILLPERYLYSNVQYSLPYTKSISFTQEIEEEDYESETEYQNALIADLRTQAQNYLLENSVPKVNYTLKANLEKITDVGDTVEVIDERLGIDLNTNLISYDYDCILKQYTELEFGNFQQKLSGLVSGINSDTSRQIAEGTSTIQVILSAELQAAQEKIMQTFSDSYVVYDGNKILVLDSLPKQNASHVIMIDNNGVSVSTTGISGVFYNVWNINGTLNMGAINIINLTADLIKGGTFKVGSNLNAYSKLEIYDASNYLISSMDNLGIKMYGKNGNYLSINKADGINIYDNFDNRIFWVSGANNICNFNKLSTESEITLCNKFKFLPVETQNSNGIGLFVS